MISRWILWRLKQLLTEKAHEMFMMYKHFLNLWISINDLYNTFQRLCDFWWTWQRRSWSFYEISHVNMCSMIWRNNSQLHQYLHTSILILNVFSKLIYLIMFKKMCSHNMTKMMYYTQLFSSHKNWTLQNWTTRFMIRNCLW